MCYRYELRVRESWDGGLFICMYYYCCNLNFPFYPAPVDLKTWRPSAFPFRPAKRTMTNVTKRHILHRSTEPCSTAYDKATPGTQKPHTHRTHTTDLGHNPTQTPTAHGRLPAKPQTIKRHPNSLSHGGTSGPLISTYARTYARIAMHVLVYISK